MIFKRALSPGCYPYSFLCMSDIILQLSERFDLEHEVLKVGLRVECHVLLKSLPGNQSMLVAHHCQLFRELLNLVVSLLVSLVAVSD